MHIDAFSLLLYDKMFVNLFCNKSIKTVDLFFWLTSVATWWSRKDELLCADCLRCGCFNFDWEWSHASKSYMVSFVSFTSGKRTLESCATIHSHSDKEASQASISSVWRAHRPISTSRQWSHQAPSLGVLPAPGCGLFGCHSHNDHQWIYISSILWTESAENRCKSTTTEVVTHCTFARRMNHIPPSWNIWHMTNLGNCKWKFNEFDMSCHGNRMSHLCCDVCQCETSHSTLWKDELSCRCNTQFLSVKHLR